MSRMTDPLNALLSLQEAINARSVQLFSGQVHRDILVIADAPNGVTRYTYVKTRKDQVGSIAIFAATNPIDDIPCFQVGWATAEVSRGRGLATQAATKGIDELKRGLSLHGVRRFYLEAIVGRDNHASMHIARKVISPDGEDITDAYSVEPAVRYLRLVE